MFLLLFETLFFAKQNKSGSDPNLANPFFADRLLKLMTSKKHHRILKIELSLTMLLTQEHRDLLFFFFNKQCCTLEFNFKKIKF